MSFNAALSAGQKTKIRSASYAGDYEISLCSNTVVFAGQVNSDLTTPTSWAQFNYNNVTTGAFGDVELDEVILMSTVNDITTATYRGRIRKAPTSSILYVSESSTDFDVGDFFWVIYSFDPTYKLSRPSTNDPATASELVDFDQTYAPPRACSVGLRTAYVDRVDPITGKMRVAFDVSSSYAVASGDSVSSYLFTFVASTYTVVSGSLSTAIVTVDFDADTEQWGKLTITTANGQVKTRRFYVRAYDTNTQADTGADETSINISGDLARGYTMTTTWFTGVDSVLNRTFAVCWRESENYGGTAGPLDTTNNIAFVGWLQREEDNLASDAQYAVLSDAHFEFTGVGPRMQRLRAQEVAIRISSSPAEWGDIVNLTPWRAIAHFMDRYSTITNLCDLNFSDKTLAYLFPDFGTQGGNLHAAVQGIAQQIAANVEFAPDGRIEVNVSAEYLTNLGRAGLVTVLDLEAQDCFNIVKSAEPDPNVGVIDGVGASYNSSSGQVSTYAALAPGHAQGEIAGSDTLQGPVLVATGFASAALIDLKQRAGNRFEVANNNEVLEMDHPDGFTFPIPSRYQLYTLTIDATVAGANGVSRIVYDTNTQWLLEAVSFARPGNGATNVHCRYRKLSRIGDPGDDITQVAQGQIEDQLPDLGLPAFNWDLPELTFPDLGLDTVNPAQLAPPPGMVAATNGQCLLVASTTHVFWLKNFITLTRPQATDITPPDLGSFTVRAVLIDPFFTKTAIGGYILASDGSNSAVWFNPNVAAPDAADNWTKGAEIGGEWNVIRATADQGGVLVYSPQTGSTCPAAPDNVSSPLISGGPNDGQPYTTFTYSGGQFTGTSAYQPFISGDDDDWFVNVNICGGGVDCYDIHVVSQSGWSALPTGGHLTADWVLCAGGDYTNTGTAPTGMPDQDITGGGYWRSHSSFSVVFTLTLNNGTTARVRYSTDFGSTFGSVILVGDTPGAVGGFDVQRAGTVSYAAAEGKVRKATTLGGAYSDWYAVPGAANPTCIVIPYFRRNSTTKNTAVSDPDVIIGCDDGTWRWIDGTAATATDITPVASLLCSHPDALTVRYGNLIAAWGTVAGQQKIYTSSNGGTSWTFRSNISSAGKLRCRRNDARLSPNGQIYLAQANVIDYSSKWFSNSLYPRTMPTTGIVMFDTVL